MQMSKSPIISGYEVYSIQHYVIKFVSDLQQVCRFLQVLQFPLQIKLLTIMEEGGLAP